MRLTSIVALLPALALAQEQAPLADRVQGWFNKAKEYLPTAAPAAPIEKMAEKVTEKRVTQLNLGNWQSILTPGDKQQDWFVFVTGGNKTCFGRCERADKAFTESVLLFSADPTAPNLGRLDCESNPVLCAIWSSGAPTVYHYQVPQAQLGEERPPTPLHIVYLNSTTITPEQIYQIHSKKLWEKVPVYEGVLHPTDGWLAKYNLNVPVGYGIWALSSIPSWLFMVLISFFSRTVMSRRMGNVGAAPQGRPAAATGSAN
ncbi:hypothetical protein NUU61_002670 [Penicillium alfredii]|uniref:Peptidyl-tRNA hydrolase n=1 Tax=Penicillium alfredii TaxID=1506179 RepID=A0A9W9FS13_9EURO|nr:uncharacterized protein NUU61_002670 [Penicillium alfredii]KAJ5105323.1 hypothetical protein NUU61_002670 [Penicillium alfredii]